MRAASAGVRRDELFERLGPALEEDLRQTTRRHHADGIAIAARILSGDQPLLAGEAHEQRTTLAQERLCKALVVFAFAQVSAQAKLVVQLVGVARVAAQLRLDLLDCVRIEQVAELFLPEQLAQEVTVERQRLRAPLGGRRVVLVHVGRDVVEEERRGVRRGRGGLDVDEIELPSAQSLQQPLQRRQVEDILQAFAVGLEDDRERAVAACDLQQALRLEALLPQRRTLVGAAARDQERTCGVLAEAGAEERALSHLLHDELLDLVRRDRDLVDRRRRIGVR